MLDHVGGALTVSFRELEKNARTRLRKLGVLAQEARAPLDIVAHLWEPSTRCGAKFCCVCFRVWLTPFLLLKYSHDDSSDAALWLSDLEAKSLDAHGAELLHDLVLDFAEDELRKLR